MKHLATAVLLLASFAVRAQSAELQKAQTKAKAEQKHILLLFSGSDWCIPCIKMEKEVIEKEAFQSYAKENLVILKADFPRLKKNQLPKEIRQENEALASQYNKEGTFPYTLLLDANGNVLKNWTGAVSETPEDFVQQLNTAKK
jgi:thioredoxin-related protein